MKEYIKVPMDIEKKSFEIIGSEMGKHNFSKEELQIVKRVIHTSADFEYKELIYIKDESIEKAKNLLKKGIKIYTDTNMALAGINKRALSKLGCTAQCYVSRDDVRNIAKDRGITRSMAAVELACSEGIEFFVFGNAPTALFKLIELTKEGKANPKFIIGAPVGFVGAAESKEELEKLDVPMITIRGRKGGSNISASIVNALMYMIIERD